jgi:hypothetical protein
MAVCKECRRLKLFGHFGVSGVTVTHPIPGLAAESLDLGIGRRGPCHWHQA